MSYNLRSRKKAEPEEPEVPAVVLESVKGESTDNSERYVLVSLPPLPSFLDIMTRLPVCLQCPLSCMASLIIRFTCGHIRIYQQGKYRRWHIQRCNDVHAHIQCVLTLHYTQFRGVPDPPEKARRRRGQDEENVHPRCLWFDHGDYFLRHLDGRPLVCRCLRHRSAGAPLQGTRGMSERASE